MHFKCLSKSAGVACLVMLLAACSGKKSPDSERLRAIERLASGEVIGKLNTDLADPKIPAISGNSNTIPEEAVRPVDAPIPDPCPKVAKPAQDAPEAELLKALREFGACVRELMQPYERVNSAIKYMKIFVMDPKEVPLSKRTDEELTEFLKQAQGEVTALDRAMGLNSPFDSKVRNQFNNDELAEFMELLARRKQLLRTVELKVYAAIDARLSLIEYFAKTLDRYAGLLALRKTSTDMDGLATAQELVKNLKALKSSARAAPDFFTLGGIARLHPFALIAFLPIEGDEDKSLNPVEENPFEVVLNIVAELGGPIPMVKSATEIYKAFRDQTKPEVPEHEPPVSDAVHVAFVDSGVDYYKYPEIAFFIGNGGGSEMASTDFVDGGTNSWAPFMGDFTHGTRTMATLLSVIARQAPEVLRERRLDLAMWKEWSARSILSAELWQRQNWIVRYALQDGLIKKIESQEPVKPKIVSVSMSFAMKYPLEVTGKKDLLKKAPWLWVMSAGNRGEDFAQKESETRNGPANCFDDISPENRDDTRILCVGALTEGIVNPEVAAYSDYGQRVDVYAMESYHRLCPSGTSCSTPAVSATAAILAAKFPMLTPAQLKQVIVNASEERELSVATKDSSKPSTPQTRKVRVFDPVGMLPRALQIAAETAR